MHACFTYTQATVFQTAHRKQSHDARLGKQAGHKKPITQSLKMLHKAAMELLAA